jgi:hypothetical protein
VSQCPQQHRLCTQPHQQLHTHSSSSSCTQLPAHTLVENTLHSDYVEYFLILIIITFCLSAGPLCRRHVDPSGPMFKYMQVLAKAQQQIRASPNLPFLFCTPCKAALVRLAMFQCKNAGRQSLVRAQSQSCIIPNRACGAGVGSVDRLPFHLCLCLYCRTDATLLGGGRHLGYSPLWQGLCRCCQQGSCACAPSQVLQHTHHSSSLLQLFDPAGVSSTCTSSSSHTGC